MSRRELLHLSHSLIIIFTKTEKKQKNTRKHAYIYVTVMSMLPLSVPKGCMHTYIYILNIYSVYDILYGKLAW